MSRLTFILSLTLFACVFAQNKSVIAVADISADGLSSFEIKQIYDRLETELVNMGRYDVTNRQDFKKILKEQKIQQSGCTDQQCAAEIGKILNADLMLISTILIDQSKNQLSATFKLVDVETAKITTATTKNLHTKSISELNEYIDDMLHDLYKKSTGEAILIQKISVDETLYEIVFNLNVNGVGCSYNQFASITSEGKRSIFKLAGGEYTFYFQKNKYRPYTKTIYVGSDQIFDVKLEEDKSQIIEYTPPGIVSIETEPSGCEIIINGQKMGTSPYSGILSSGEHQVELRKELYYTSVLSFSLSAGETKNVRQKLDPKFGFLNIASNPEKVKITVDGKRVGETPLSQIKLLSGRHEITAEKELYHSIKATYDIDDGVVKSIDIVLKEAYGKMQISSSPHEGAEVTIDGKKRGTTPFLFDPCPSGRYLVEINKQYFNPSSELVIVTDGANVKRTLILTPNVGTLIVKSEQADIYINDEKIGKGTYEGKLSPGKYKVKLDKKNYYPVIKDVIINVGKTKELELDMSPIQGSISVFVSPVEARNGEIFINGSNRGNAPKIVTLPIGIYAVKVEADGYLPAAKNVVVEENKNTSVEFNLLSYAGSVQQDIDTWKRRTKLGVYSTLTCALLIGGCDYASNMSFKHYLVAHTTSEALKYKTRTQIFDGLKLGGSGLGITLALGTCYSFVISRLSSLRVRSDNSVYSSIGETIYSHVVSKISGFTDRIGERKESVLPVYPENSTVQQWKNKKKPNVKEKYVIPTSPLYVWDSPKVITSKIIKKIYSNQKLPIIEFGKNYILVKLGNKTGYVWNTSESFYVVDKDNKPVNGQYVKITVTNDNIRSGPSTNYTIIKICRKYETYALLDLKNGWYKIKINKSTIGYTHKSNGNIIFRQR